MWYFTQKEYQKFVELLVADNSKYLRLNLCTKVLLLKIYYKLGEFQLLDALVNRFGTYLSRQKNRLSQKILHELYSFYAAAGFY
jgi:hypothetical protein